MPPYTVGADSISARGFSAAANRPLQHIRRNYAKSYLPACKIVSTHGVRGEMKALPLCDGAAFLAKFKRLFTTADGAGETRVLGVRAQGNVTFTAPRRRQRYGRRPRPGGPGVLSG